jgi:hypothetical protein
MVPVFVVARLPPPMGNEEDLDAGCSGCRYDGTQMVEQADFICDALHQRPELSAVRQEVVVGIDQEQPGP